MSNIMVFLPSSVHGIEGAPVKISNEHLGLQPQTVVTKLVLGQSCDHQGITVIGADGTRTQALQSHTIFIQPGMGE